MSAEPTLVELDSRHRAALGRLARHARYLAEVDDDGIITLTPAAVVSAVEAALISRRPDLLRPADRSKLVGVKADRRYAG
ncbi:MAG: hypothetical protein ACRDY7_05455 [Acidimicrobiia bacterium]